LGPSKVATHTKDAKSEKKEEENRANQGINRTRRGRRIRIWIKERGSRSRRIRRGKGRRTRVGMSAAIHFRETLVNFSS